jgi:hypothetical protein
MIAVRGKNMSYLPLFILLAFLAILAFIVLRVIKAPMREVEERQSKIAAYRNRESQAVWAGATVVTVNKPKIDSYGMRQLKVDLRLEVESPSGEKYQVKTAWLVDEGVMPQIQPGASVSVKIDVEDPEIIYPNMPGVEYWVES